MEVFSNGVVVTVTLCPLCKDTVSYMGQLYQEHAKQGWGHDGFYNLTEGAGAEADD